MGYNICSSVSDMVQWFHIKKSKLNYIPIKAKYDLILIVDTLVTGGNGKGGGGVS